MKYRFNNIMQLWSQNDEDLPFIVRRNTWSEYSLMIVVGVRIREWPYGVAWGYYVNDGRISEKEQDVKCAGNFSWELLIDKDLLEKFKALEISSPS